MLATPTRRLLAVLAMLAGLGLAWWTTRPRVRHVKAVFLLTHVNVELRGLVLDRSRLVQLAWRPSGGQAGGRREALDFAVGMAPEVTLPQEVALPLAATTLDVTCQFALAAGTQPVRSRGRVQIDPNRDGEQTVDVECAEVVR